MTETATTTGEITVEKLFEDALTLSPEERERLIDLLTPYKPIKPLKSLAQLAAEQGKKPLKYEELRKLGEFFPEDESVDELIEFIRESRRDTHQRSLD